MIFFIRLVKNRCKVVCKSTAYILVSWIVTDSHFLSILLEGSREIRRPFTGSVTLLFSFSVGWYSFYNTIFFGEIRFISIFETKYRFKWWALAFQLDIDITFAERLKAEIW